MTTEETRFVFRGTRAPTDRKTENAIMNATESQIRAEQIVRGLYDRGVDFIVIDGKLNYKGMLGDIVTDDDLADLSNYEVEIIALLLKEDTPNNVIPLPAPCNGREKKSPRKGVLDYWNAAMADIASTGDEAG